MKAAEMIVEGNVIPKGICGAIIRRMKGKKPFRCSDIAGLAMKQLDKREICLVSERKHMASRIADRVIQKARKDGDITRSDEAGSRMYWSWIQ